MKKIVLYLFSVVLLTACDRVTEEQFQHVVSKAGAAEYLECTPTSMVVSCGNNRRTVNIQSNIRWNVTSSVPWIFPLSMSGTGDGTTELSIMENFEQQRSGVVTISGTTSSGEIVRQINVTQAWCKRQTTQVYIGKKGDRLIAYSGTWPATSRLKVDFYFIYYMRRYEYTLYVEKGSFWTEDSEGIPWSDAFPDELVIESVSPDHDESTIFEIREDQRPQ